MTTPPVPEDAALEEVLRVRRIAVVVPCYNEETQVHKVVETMPDFVDHIVIIDDCSTDDTAGAVERLQRDHPTVVLLRHKVNQGVGGAIASGYEWARDNDVDCAAVMAGDAQMDPEDLPRLLEPVLRDEVDYAKGNRLITGEAFRRIPKVRFFGNAILSLLTKIASGYWHVGDSQTGYTVINRRGLHAIEWRDMYRRYGQPNDLLVRLNVSNMRVQDVEVQPVYDVGERSGITYRVVFTISWLLVRLFAWRLKEKYIIRDFHPLIFFYVQGLFLTLVTLGMAVRVIWLTASFGFVPELSAIGLMFAATLSATSFFFAMWFDFESNKHLAPPTRMAERVHR